MERLCKLYYLRPVLLPPVYLSSHRSKIFSCVRHFQSLRRLRRPRFIFPPKLIVRPARPCRARPQYVNSGTERATEAVQSSSSVERQDDRLLHKMKILATLRFGVSRPNPFSLNRRVLVMDASWWSSFGFFWKAPFESLILSLKSCILGWERGLPKGRHSGKQRRYFFFAKPKNFIPTRSFEKIHEYLLYRFSLHINLNRWCTIQ